MGFTSIRAAINTKLLAITELAAVYRYHTFDMEKYPAATFEPSELASEFYTNSDDKNVYVFTIIIHQQIPPQGRDESLRRLLVAVDAVKIALAADYNLGGVVDRSNTTAVTFGQYVEGNSTVKFASFRYECMAEERALPLP